MSAANPSGHPERIGPYHILQLVGEGGMGVVYEAEQREPVRRRVALKMMKAGMDTKEVVGRFEAERQALAVMDHPGIAKVFDAGASEHGRPYFVMELVRGVRLDDYCNERRLSTRERVELFIGVCEAVQHAHQKGVIHRDLKPSNILVTEQGGRPRPKVIDFGVAKATGQRLTKKTVVTTHGQALGTLAYMSPEQATMTGLDVDTRSDVYSLGVVLYELLTGVVPLDPSEVGAPVFLAQLVEHDATMPTPSRRLTTLGDERRRLAARFRGTDVRRLRNELSGDLQWVVMKAMEKDRVRRYETANGLAADLQRFLSDEPVSAHPPSAHYRFGKFVRRNTAAAAAAAFAAIVLAVAGLSIYSSRNEALAEASRAEAVNQFLVELLGSADPAEDGRDVRVADVLDRASEEATERFADTQVAEGAIRLALGRTYRGLGLYADAEEELLQAVGLYRDIGDQNLVSALHELGVLQTQLGDFEAARALQDEELQVGIDRFGDGSLEVADARSAIGERFFYEGDIERAAELFAGALTTYEALLDEGTELVVNGRSNLSAALHRLGRIEEAADLNAAALQGMVALRGPDHVDVATVSGNLAIVLQEIGRMDEVEGLLVDALRIHRAAYGENSDRVARSINNLAVYYRRIGRFDEAEELLREAIDINTSVYGAVHRETATNVHNLGLVLFETGRPEEAAAMHARALEVNLEVRPDHATVPQSRASLAWAYAAMGRLAEAERILAQARTDAVAVFGEDHYQVANLDVLSADVIRRAGRPTEAEPLLQSALPRLRDELPSTHAFVRRVYQHLVWAYEDLGDDTRAAEFRAFLEPGR